jgi:hypothetical protein
VQYDRRRRIPVRRPIVYRSEKCSRRKSHTQDCRGGRQSKRSGNNGGGETRKTWAVGQRYEHGDGSAAVPPRAKRETTEPSSFSVRPYEAALFSFPCSYAIRSPTTTTKTLNERSSEPRISRFSRRIPSAERGPSRIGGYMGGWGCLEGLNVIEPHHKRQNKLCITNIRCLQYLFYFVRRRREMTAPPFFARGRYRGPDRKSNQRNQFCARWNIIRARGLSPSLLLSCARAPSTYVRCKHVRIL